MLMAMIAEKHPERVIVGRDAQSAFNTVRRERRVLHQHEWLWSWIDYWLSPRQFDVEVDGQVLGNVTMTGGTPQGSPLSPALFTIYMSSVVWDAERRLTQRGWGQGIEEGEAAELLATLLH